MRYRVADVCFPVRVADKILGRCITEEDVLEALRADPDLGDDASVVVERGPGRRGGTVFWALCRVPGSGRYLEVGFELTDDGTAWCYHAMEMRRRLRQRYERER